MKETVTGDGRDLSNEEWRKIPGFDRYELTKDGDVRTLKTGRLLQETKRAGAESWSYKLIKPDGKQTNRNWQSLVNDTFPELKPEPKVVDKTGKEAYKVKTHCKRGHEYNEENTHITVRGYRDCRVCRRLKEQERRKEHHRKNAILDDGGSVGHLVWRVATDFPLYEIQKTGAVREINSGRLLEMSRNRFGRFYHLRKGSRVIAVQRKKLLEATFPKKDAS